ncbi:expansin-A16-like [Asparagus officinalis]|uniref:expansin-A16-like n=1 Tax=Asparagus officinalis TaxID=4686 RepID=UPI00098DE1DB|nr:expansin-A16-like [Asparagus officinalis]
MALHLKTTLLFFHFILSLTLATPSSSLNSKDEGEEGEWIEATATFTSSPDSSTLAGGACGYGDLNESGYGKHTASAVSGALFSRGEACFEVRCVDHILWCRQGSPSIVVTATDFCAPNYGLADDYGGWCNYPREHFEMSEFAFVKIAVRVADIVPVQYRRVNCERYGGIRFTVTGSSYFLQILITNVASDGQVTAVKVKGSRTGWIPMGRNWGQNWQCNTELRGQPLSFEVTNGAGRMLTSYNVAPSNWQFGQTFEGKQFER